MRTFRVKLTALWRQAFSGLVAGAIVGRISLWIQGEPFSLPSTLPLMAVAAVMVAALYWLSPVLAGAPGVKAMNYWGLRRLVAWSDVQSADLTRQFGLHPSIKLVDRQGRSYWIPRETRELSALHAIAVQFGGAGHPLARVLQTPLHAL